MSGIINATNLEVANIKDSTGTNTAMTIDDTGRILTPQRPAFRVNVASQQTMSTNEVTILFADNGTSVNNFLLGGITISSGVITVPVSGLYCFSTVIRANSIGSGYATAKILRNSMTDGQAGTYIIIGNNRSTDYDNLSGSTVYNMNANDTVKVQMQASADTSWSVNIRSEFSGYLIG